ncbi:sigma 54-interacting transcriptional regulator [Eubacterium limosum]|uniref:Sigma 54-interacting transcriptional regulator n=1 Tax=Eubacterium limosum TaxID=1736 RepID=A0ABT5UVU5_EUBLI|nr:sigma 54-interacting transcriptional regulator [Eubacterium limosum]MCB6569386.1 sigma 54-interacting transcriptional regulator [Eubacterium limosum]MDE1471637.1 sigma 54-interacting transcriptional regulator [Eubacterium limosum]
MSKNNSLLYRELEEVTIMGIQIVDINHKVICYSKGCELIEGYKRKDVLGKDMNSLYNQRPELKNNSSRSVIVDTFETKTPQRDVFVSYTTKNSDRIINVLCDTYLLYDNTDNIKSVICVFRDISDYLNLISLVNRLNAELNLQNPNLSNDTQYTFDHLIGISPEFLDAVEQAKRISASDESVLIVGETGTGKELFAQSIHNASKRSHKRFIALNCSALPENLMESTLFGTCKGAFTGALNQKGLLEAAEGSTLFLDEINSMDIGLQAKLLRVLETKRYRKVGSSLEQSCDIRFISAMNQPPQKAIADKKIRLDLYYRIAVFSLSIPPLRARKEDILYLSNYFIKALAPPSGKKISALSQKTAKLFENYAWQGNVRELKHVILQSIYSARENEMLIEPRHLQNHSFENILSHPVKGDSLISVSTSSEGDLSKKMNAYEKGLIQQALAENNHNVTKTAEYLKITRQSLHGKIKKHSIITKKDNSSDN